MLRIVNLFMVFYVLLPLLIFRNVADKYRRERKNINKKGKDDRPQSPSTAKKVTAETYVCKSCYS